MTNQGLPTDDRLLDLLALRATEGLSAEAELELGAWADSEVLDEAAAVLSIGMTFQSGMDPMPANVESAMHRIIIDRGWEDQPQQTQDLEPLARIEPKPAQPAVTHSNTQQQGRLSLLGIGGWLAAAACLAILVVTLAPKQAPSIEQRLLAMESEAGVIRTAWAGLDDAGFSESPHAFDQELTGEVVWNPETNEGFMVFEGLGDNNPSEYQYQLWIFDSERRTGDLPQFGEGILSQRPVDGGVFDARAGRVIVPIDPKLPIGSAAIFAITVEPPGGVVVSDRDIVTLALVQ